MSQNRESNQYKLFTDGGSRGNPGRAAYAFVVYEGDSVYYEEKGYLGITTNNVAEYTALLKGLEYLEQKGICEIDCYSDSELMVRQVNGIYKVKDENLKVLFDKVNQLKRKFVVFSISHILRSKNKLADKLVNNCLDNLNG